MAQLCNKVALVTASTKGIGFAIAQRLAANGAHVVVCSRKKENVDAAVNELTSKKQKVTGMVCDAGQSSDRKLLMNMINQKFGGLDILVSNVAVNPYFEGILTTPESVYDKILDTNVKSAFMLIQETVPLMRKKGGGAIVTISSAVGFLPNFELGTWRGFGVYGISKSALIALTKAFAPELRDLNVRVNCVAPGLIKTEFSAELLQRGEKSTAAELKVSRIGVPEDCAGAVSFLCSDDASYITGETIVVSGGIPCRF